MKVVEIYSHLNGLEYLQVHLPELWEEIKSVIESVDSEICKTKKSRERGKVGKLLYSPIDMNRKFKELLEEMGWKESRTQYYVTANVKLARETLWYEPAKQKEVIESGGSEALYTYNQTDFVKKEWPLKYNLENTFRWRTIFLLSIWLFMWVIKLIWGSKYCR